MRVFPVRVPLPDLALSILDDDFAPLVLGYLGCSLDGLGLGGMSRSSPGVTLSLYRPFIALAHDPLILT